MKDVEQRIAAGEIPPLTQDVLEADKASLAEDLLNWDHGHCPEWCPVVVLLVIPDRHLI